MPASGPGRPARGAASRPDRPTHGAAPGTGARYLGLAGSTALAAGAYQVGALPGAAARDSLPGLDETAGILACLVGLVALTVAWWSVLPRQLTGRWVLTTAGLWAVPLLVAPPLASRDMYAYACQGAVARGGGDPAAVSPADLPCAWLDSVPPIWQDATSPYGPLFTLLSAAAGGHIAVAVGVFRAVALAGILLSIGYGRSLAIACGVDPARAGWLALASPLVLVHAIGGAHNDALMTGLIVAGLAGAVAGRGGWAGLALGLAAAVKVTALLALPFALIPLLARPAWRAAGTLFGPAVASYAALALITGSGLDLVKALGRTSDLAQWTSVPTAFGMTAGYLLRAVGVDGYDAAIAVARALGLAVLAGLVAVLWWRARRARSPRHVVAATGIAFAGLALLGPVFYPWYALTPLALLAVSTVDERVRARLGAATAGLAFLVLPNGTGLAPRTKLPGALLVTAATVAAAARWIRGPRPARDA